MTQKVRTRFAPSPTGFIHLGNIRSALYPWAFARATGGDFIPRTEHTHVARSTQAPVHAITQGTPWPPLDHPDAPSSHLPRTHRHN
ncbi:MAG: glutamate--tRNA ligase, partial [Delftia sp.]|nr:glutamate--tRNA ligase [Delftia sp.]